MGRRYFGDGLSPFSELEQARMNRRHAWDWTVVLVFGFFVGVALGAMVCYALIGCVW